MNRLLRYWSDISWKTRLVSLTILVISLALSSLVFLAFVSMQKESSYLDLYFSKDLSLLLNSYIFSVVQNSINTEVRNLIENIYLNSSCVSYLQFFNSNGNLVCVFPTHDLVFQNIISFDYSFTISFSFDNTLFDFTSIVYKQIMHFTFPIISNNNVANILRVGLIVNSSILFISSLMYLISAFIFVSIWLVFILGALDNTLILTEANQYLLQGIKQIAEGNFTYRIKSKINSRIKDLIFNFNNMSEHLSLYEKKNVEELTYEKAKLETLITIISDGVLLLDNDLRLLFVNQVAVKTFQWSNKKLIGTLITQHLPLNLQRELLPILNSLIKSNCLGQDILKVQELYINLGNDSLKTIRILLAMVMDYRCSSFNGLVMTIKDITRETQLNEAKNHFISNVSHELRTPLCNIGSFLETLIDYDHKLSLKQKKQFLGIAYIETQRLNRLVNDILDLSKLESKYVYTLKSINLMHICLYIVKLYQWVALNKSNQILLEISESTDQVFAHESSLCQVLSNLISNSLKFTHVNGNIVIRVYPLLRSLAYKLDGCRFYTRIRVEIIDEGIGINRVFFKQIFDRFTRIENNIHVLKGTGLGLSIVKNIIHKHNSNISIYSEVGVGTSFWFDLSVNV